jgi:hypothetical protein
VGIGREEDGFDNCVGIHLIGRRRDDEYEVRLVGESARA